MEVDAFIGALQKKGYYVKGKGKGKGKRGPHFGGGFFKGKGMEDQVAPKAKARKAKVVTSKVTTATSVTQKVKTKAKEKGASLQKEVRKVVKVQAKLPLLRVAQEMDRL